MSQTLDILIKIRQTGEESIKGIIARMKELQATMQDANASPFASFAASADRANKSLAEINNNVGAIKGAMVDAIDEVVSQAIDKTDSTVTRLSGSFDELSEKMFSRFIAVAGTAALVATQAGQAFAQKMFEANTYLGLGEVLWQTIYGRAAATNNAVLGLVTNTGTLGGMVGGVAGMMGRLAAGSFALSAYRFFFSEAQIFFGRLAGFGQTALTPIERAVRLITTLDTVLVSSTFRWGQLIRTVGFGLFAWLGPFSAILSIFPFLNSFVDMLLSKFEMGRLKFFAFFGSGRAQLQILFLTLKDALLNAGPALAKLVPVIIKIANAFVAVTKGMTAGNFEALFRPFFRVDADVLPKAMLRVADSIRTIIEYIKLLNPSLTTLLKQKEALAAPSKMLMPANIPSQGFQKDKIAGTATTLNATQIASFVTLEKNAAAAAAAARPPLLDFNMAVQNTLAIFAQSSKQMPIATAAWNDFVKSLAAAKNAKQADVLAKGGVARFIEAVIIEGKQLGVVTDAVALSLNQIRANLAKPVRFAEFRDLLAGIIKGEFPGAKNVKGDKIAKVLAPLAAGIESSLPEVKKAMNATTDIIMQFLPNPTVKNGPLVKMVGSGEKLSHYLGQGILNGKQYIMNSAHTLAELFAKHFPRSLPALGPLVHIVESGALLPFYLAKGIMQGIGFVRDAAMALAGKFSEVFQAGVDTRLKATKLDISAEAVSGLDAVFKRFGSSFSEAEFPLAKLNDAIAKGTPEDIAKFEALGISIEKIKASSDPAVAAMLSLSDVLETSKQGSIAYTTALELMGLMASSNLVIGLRQGSGVIRGEFNNAVERGVVVTTKFADASLKFKQVFDKLKDTAQSVLADVLGPILPELSKVADGILALFTTYRVEIAAFLELLGQAVGVVVSLVTKIVTAAITQPGKMLGSLRIMGKAVMDFVGEIFKTIADFILNNVVMVGGILFQSTLAVAAQIFNEVGAALAPYLDFAIVAVEKFMLDALASVVNKFGDFLRKIPEFGLKLLIALGSLFTDLARYINTQLQKLLIGALASLSDYISKSPNLTKVINFLGLKEVTDNLQEFKDRQAQLNAQLDADTTKTEWFRRFIIRDIALPPITKDFPSCRRHR